MATAADGLFDLTVLGVFCINTVILRQFIFARGASWGITQDLDDAVTFRLWKLFRRPTKIDGTLWGLWCQTKDSLTVLMTPMVVF